MGRISNQILGVRGLKAAVGHVTCGYPILPFFFLPWKGLVLMTWLLSSSESNGAWLVCEYLSVSFGSVILCEIQEQLSLVVVDQLWLDSSELKVKNVWQISLVCWWNSFSLLKLFNFYGIKPPPLLVLVSKVVKKTKAWNIQLNILCLIHFIFQDDWVLLRWITATL